MYMKMSQGNTPCSDLKQTKNKDVIFFFYKIEEQESRTCPVTEVGTSGNGEMMWEGEYSANTI
jgi:hypothetical protein